MFMWHRERVSVRGGDERIGRMKCRPALECLERRELLTTGTQPYLLTGDRWSNAGPISFSIADDGVMWDRKENVLNAAMGARFVAGTWQDEVARALQTWASVADVDFVRVADSALAFDTFGKAQGDARFGDIRFGGYDFGNANQLAHAHTPPPNGSTAAGDVAVNTAMAFNIGGDYDLYSVLLHETGHSLGLEHPDNLDAVMNENYGGVRAGPTADDIAGIRAIYGARADDVHGQQGRGSGVSDAVALAISPASPSRLALADLTLTSIGDSDYFSYVPPTGGTLQVTAIAQGVSLLSPQVSVYDGSQALLATEGSPAQYGQNVSASIAAVTAGQPYYIKVSGATNDVFSIGTYALNISLDGGQAVGTMGRFPLPPRASTPLPGTPSITPPTAPSAPPTEAWTSHPARTFRQPAWRKQMPRFAALWQRRLAAIAEGQARSLEHDRQGTDVRVAQRARSLAASEGVFWASRLNRGGKTLALRLPG